MISIITNKQDQNCTRFPVVDYFFGLFTHGLGLSFAELV